MAPLLVCSNYLYSMCHSFSDVADKRLCMYFVAGLLKVLIIGIYISLVEVPYVYSKPTSSSYQNAMSGKGDWWINPNNYTSNLNETSTADDGTAFDKMKSLDPLRRQVNASLQRAKESVSSKTLKPRNKWKVAFGSFISSSIYYIL